MLVLLRSDIVADLLENHIDCASEASSSTSTAFEQHREHIAICFKRLQELPCQSLPIYALLCFAMLGHALLPVSRKPWAFGNAQGKKLRFKTKLLTCLVALLTTSLSLWGWVGSLSAFWYEDLRDLVFGNPNWEWRSMEKPRLPSRFLPSLLLDKWQCSGALWFLSCTCIFCWRLQYKIALPRFQMMQLEELNSWQVRA